MCFTDIIVARDFLEKQSLSRTVRNIDISLRIKPIITELYYPSADGEPQPHIGGIAMTSKNNPWEDLCRHLSSMPNLRELHFRFDSEDLRPWHKRVNEKAFFAQLFQVQARKFVLNLPDIPGDPEAQGLPGCYLEDAGLQAKAPFELKRGSRPNNWQLHLARVSPEHSYLPAAIVDDGLVAVQQATREKDTPTDKYTYRYHMFSQRIGVTHCGIRCETGSGLHNALAIIAELAAPHGISRLMPRRSRTPLPTDLDARST